MLITQDASYAPLCELLFYSSGEVFPTSLSRISEFFMDVTSAYIHKLTCSVYNLPVILKLLRLTLKAAMCARNGRRFTSEPEHGRVVSPQE